MNSFEVMLIEQLKELVTAIKILTREIKKK